MHRLTLSCTCLLALTVAILSFSRPSPAPAAGKDDGTIHLFNGKDLKGFYTYLGAQEKGGKPFGKNNDPLKVFTVQDGMIRVSGQVYGGFITEKEYENYHLIVEFKWGEKTFPPREKAARDSGVLLHGVGEDGAAGGFWLESVECQMIEGGTGDFILVGGKGRPSLTATVEMRPTGAPGTKIHEEAYYKPNGTPKEFKSGRINWFARDPEWRDVKGFRGKKDVEKPVGEWNRLEVICDGDKITNMLNGTVVNVGTKCSVTKGKILFQSEGAEVFFRRIDLKPLGGK
jgi:hypothetical protein